MEIDINSGDIIKKFDYHLDIQLFKYPPVYYV